MAALVAMSAPAACGNATGLVGEWEATRENAEGTSFVFREDGSALWLLPDTFLRPGEFGGEQTRTFSRRGGGGS